MGSLQKQAAFFISNLPMSNIECFLMLAVIGILQTLDVLTFDIRHSQIQHYYDTNQPR